ncbi:retrovirus-related pol polyprotein from transposon TNT 1-94 [Tanacetum coccineum]
MPRVSALAGCDRLGTVRFGNDQFAPILGYGDLVQGNITINRVYYVEGLNHNLFSIGQFCDADLEVAFWKSTCFVRDLQGNALLTGNRGTDLYIISLQETTSSTPISLMAKASPTQAWLWHRRLSYLNFEYINFLSKKTKYVKDQLCSSCEIWFKEISTINRVYYVEGLNHNLFSVGQFCDANLEVAFRKSTCFVRDLQGNDLLIGNRGTRSLYNFSSRNNFINSNLSHG